MRYFEWGERGEDEGLARMCGRYLRKKWQNRAKNEVRPRAWPLRLAHHFVFWCAPKQLLLRTRATFAAHHFVASETKRKSPEVNASFVR